MKKIIVTCILFLGLGLTGFAQSEKVKEKATQKVEELNKEIMAEDPSLALSEEQKSQVYEIHVKRIMATRKANKSEASEEDKKAIQKSYFKKIYSEVLTKEQRKARKAGKEKTKE